MFSQSSVYPVKVHVFAAVCGNGDLFGPYFIEGGLTSQKYIDMLREEVLPDIKAKLGEEEFSKMWFQQDGASPHRTRAAIDYLHSVFGNRLIALNSARVGGTDWPSTSPDLSTLDYHTWKAIEEKLYFGPNPPHDLASLKSGLVEAFRLVDRDEIQRAVTQGFRNRVKKCLEQGGGHFEGKRVKEGKPHKISTSIEVLPFHFIHICEKSSTEKLIIGPASYQLLPGEILKVPPSPFIHIPRRHCALIKFEGRVERRTGESFPLFPGESLEGFQKLNLGEGEEETGLDFMPSPIPSDSPEVQGPGLVFVPPCVSLSFVAEGKSKILDLDDKIKEDLNHDLNILQEIFRLAASLKDSTAGLRIQNAVRGERENKEGAQSQFTPKSPICLQSPRSSRRASTEANETIFRSPLFARARSPRQRTPSPSPRSPKVSGTSQGKLNKQRGEGSGLVFMPPSSSNAVQLLKQPARIPPITAEMRSIITEVFSLPNITSEVADHFGIKIRRSAIDTLKVKEWLSSDIIEIMFKLIEATHKSTHSLGFHFGQFLSNLGHEGVRRYTRKIDIFSFKKIILPVYSPGHWSCVGVNLEEKTITYFDSLNRKNQVKQSVG